jgi:uncharacterized phage protein (TIGR02216 family)
LRAAAGKDGNLPPPFPWGLVMHTGLCLLRLPAKDFWSMSPKEMQAAFGGLRPAAAVPDRSGMDALMAAFPD